MAGSSEKTIAADLQRHSSTNALRESEERFRALTDHATELIAEIGPDGRYTYVSPSFLEILGHDPESLIGTSSGALIHPDDLAESRKSFRQAVERGATAHAVHRLRHGDGSWRCVDNTGRAYKRANGDTCFVSLGRDITEMTRLSDELEHSLSAERQIGRLSRRLLDPRNQQINDHVVEGLREAADFAGADRAFFLVFAGHEPRIVETHEWSCADSLKHAGSLDLSIVEPLAGARASLEADGIYAVTDTRLHCGEAERCALEVRGARATSAIAIRADGQLVGILGFDSAKVREEWADSLVRQLRVIGELIAMGLQRRRAEVALERQLEFERHMARLSKRFLSLEADEIEPAIHNAIAETGELAGADRVLLLSLRQITKDEPEVFEWGFEGGRRYRPGRYEWATPRLLAGEVIHMPSIADLPSEAELEREQAIAGGVRSLLWIPVHSGDRLVAFLSLTTTREEKRWSRDEIAMLRLVGDLLASSLARRDAQRALEESRDQLIQAQKMDAIGRLAGGVAHDFNNILTVILGFSRALRDDAPKGDPVREDAEEIHAAAERAAALTKQLLTFSRRQGIAPQSVEIGDNLRSAKELLERLLEEDVALVFDVSREDAWVRCEPSQLEQVWMNLAVNARDAMPQGGEIRIRSEIILADAALASRLALPPGRYVRVSVSDDGEGMDEETRSHVFEPFYTTKDPGKGTGLGLSIVYRVVEQCQGAIEVDSKPGSGTSVHLFFPLASAELDPAQPTADGELPAGRETVLLVEDQAALRRLGRRMLERAGYRVLEACDGLEALDLVREKGNAIDLLISDVVMPRMGGGDLARTLRTERPELPVLFVSGYAQERGRRGSEPLPAASFLPKPFEESELLQAVRNVLDDRSHPARP